MKFLFFGKRTHATAIGASGDLGLIVLPINSFQRLNVVLLRKFRQIFLHIRFECVLGRKLVALEQLINGMPISFVFDATELAHTLVKQRNKNISMLFVLCEK